MELISLEEYRNRQRIAEWEVKRAGEPPFKNERIDIGAFILISLGIIAIVLVMVSALFLDGKIGL